MKTRPPTNQSREQHWFMRSRGWRLLLISSFSLLLGGVVPLHAVTTSEYELWVQSGYQPPTIGQRLGAAVSDYLDSAQQYWESKEFLIKAIKAARARYWETYPDKPGHKEAAEHFREVLYSRDLFVMSTDLDRSNVGQLGPENPLTRLHNLTLDGGPKDPDKELEVVISLDFGEWVAWNRKITQDGLRNLLQKGYGGMTEGVLKDAPEMWRFYDNYCLKRDAAEHVYRSPSLRLAFKDGLDFYRTAMLANWGPGKARIRQQMWQRLIGPERIKATVDKVFAASINEVNREILPTRVEMALANEAAQTDLIAAILVMYYPIPKEGWQGGDFYDFIQAEAGSFRRKYDEETIARAWRSVKEATKTDWPKSDEVLSNLGLKQLPKKAYIDEMLHREPNEKNTAMLTYLGMQLQQLGDANQRQLGSELVKRLAKSEGGVWAAFIVADSLLEQGAKEQAIAVLENMDLRNAGIFADSLERIKLEPADKTRVVRTLAKRLAEGASGELREIVRYAPTMFQQDREGGLAFLMSIPEDYWRDYSGELAAAYETTANPDYRSRILQYFLGLNESGVYMDLPYNISTGTWQIKTPRKESNRDAKMVRLAVDVLAAKLKLPKKRSSYSASDQVRLYVYVAAQGGPDDWRRLADCVDGFNEEQRESIRRDKHMMLVDDQNNDRDIALGTIRMVDGILSTAPQPGDTRRLLKLAALDFKRVSALTPRRIPGSALRTAAALQMVVDGSWQESLGILKDAASSGYRPAILAALNIMFDGNRAKDLPPASGSPPREFSWLVGLLEGLAKQDAKTWQEASREASNFVQYVQWGTKVPFYNTRLGAAHIPPSGGPRIGGKPLPGNQELMAMIYREMNLPEEEQAGATSVVQSQAKPVGPVTAVAPDSPPQVIASVSPVYPSDLRRSGVKGSVEVEFIVMADGTVTEVKVIRSTQREFEAAAMDAVQQWRFRPGLKGGKPVNVRIQTQIEFTVQSK